MQVYKFGGASVSTPDRIRNVARIIAEAAHTPLLVVISAIGKTTNALEGVVDAFVTGSLETLVRFTTIKEEHNGIAEALGLDGDAIFRDHYTEVEWLLHDKPVRSYDYYYDQIVGVGELLSTALVHHYFSTEGLGSQWIDIRDVLRTDNRFRQASVDWNVTAEKAKEAIAPLLIPGKPLVIQGFIGATDDNETTTLGREGSDYTAALFSNLLGAERLTIWKDVPGVMNADPKQYEGAQLIPHLDYRECIEMAFYGAQVIHPKTVKPLQNRGIPLHVRSFVDAAAEGTVIAAKAAANLPPIIVYKHDQVLLTVTTPDYSFIGEGSGAALLGRLEENGLQANLTQNGAIAMMLVVDDRPETVDAFAAIAAQDFGVTLQRGLTLLTIRHYDEEVVQKLAPTVSILQQRTPETVQWLYAGVRDEG